MVLSKSDRVPCFSSPFLSSAAPPPVPATGIAMSAIRYSSPKPSERRCAPRSTGSPRVGLLVQSKRNEGLRLGDPRDGANLVVEQPDQVLVVLADDLEDDVEATRGEHHVVDLADFGEGVGNLADVAVDPQRHEGDQAEAQPQRSGG